MSRLDIADTGLFVAMGQPSNGRYQAVRRFARRNDITFVLPERVYEELTVDDSDVDSAVRRSDVEVGGGRLIEERALARELRVAAHQLIAVREARTRLNCLHGESNPLGQTAPLRPP